MAEARKLTKAMLKALAWFETSGPVAWFAEDAPSRMIRKRLEAYGLIERCGQDDSGAHFLRPDRFRISAAGRSALTETRR